MKLHVDKDSRPDSEKETFGSGICNNAYSFLLHYLTLLSQHQLFNIHIGHGQLTVKYYCNLTLYL